MSGKTMHSGVVNPTGIWWGPMPKQEKMWITVAFIWCMILFAMMPLWHIRGGQNPSGIRAKVDPQAYKARVDRFINDYKVGVESGIPVVAPPAGSHIYLLGQMWNWSPVLQLKKGVEYTLHLSALDVNHGFSLFPVKLNFQVVPGYDYGLKIVPNVSGDFKILCNEYCGLGHHLMVGKVVVTD